MHNPVLLEVSNIDLYYGELHVLWDVSLKVYDGEVVSVIGPNGAGKTSLLNAISGIHPIRSGSIYYMDERIDGLPPHYIVRKGIVHVPEGREIFPELTVIENLLLGAYTLKDHKEIERNLQKVYELFPVLKTRKKQKAGTLSGGEQQMLSIARGLMSNPRILLVDEPSQGLSPILVSELFKTIKEINKDGTTILLVEQNVHYSLALAHRAYVLENGKIVLSGEGKSLLHHEYVKKAYLGV